MRAVHHRGKERPAFTLFHAAFGFVSPHLLIERVEKLLAGGRAGECGAVIQRAAEPPVIQEPFGRAVEHDAHAVQQIDNAGRRFAHALYQRLIGQKIAAVNRVVKVLIGSVALALLVFRGVDPALRANGV